MPIKSNKQKKLELAVSLFTFSPDCLLENLSENDKKEIYAGCSTIYTNPVFKKVCDELYTRDISTAIINSHDLDTLAESRGQLFGVAALRELIKKYHDIYIDSIKHEEKMTSEEKQEII